MKLLNEIKNNKLQKKYVFIFSIPIKSKYKIILSYRNIKFYFDKNNIVLKKLLFHITYSKSHCYQYVQSACFQH